MRLWLYLTLIVNATILIAFTGYGAYTAHEQTHFHSESIKRDSLNLGQTIAAGSANDILTESFDQIENRLLFQVTISSVQELLITDAQGMVIARVQRTPEGKARAMYDQMSTPIDLRMLESQSGDTYTRLVPIDRGERLGWVRVTSSLADAHEIRRHIWLDTLVASLLTVVLIGTLLAVVLRRSGRMLEAASRFASDLIHQRGATIKTDSRVKEVSQLKTALNEVSQALAQQYQAMQDSKSLKTAILEASLDALITIDQEGRIVDFNPAAETTFGYRRDEAIGQMMGELIVPQAYRVAHDRGLRHYLETGHGPVLRKRIEIVALRRNNQEFPIELSIVPFDIGDKRFFLGSLRDISERKALEAEQQRITDALHQTVSDLAAQQFALDEHAIVSITDLEGNITYANEKFQQISQYSSEELLGKNHRILKSGMHNADFYENMWATITAGKAWHGEIANRRKDGDLYWVAATIVPMLGEDGLPYQYISIRTDITHQKRTEQQLDLYRQHLEQMVEQYREAELNLDRARARELAIGHQIQRSLLFGDVPANIGALSIATHTEASKGIDGDFYEFFSYSPYRFDIAIGDVMGKGIPAALIGAALKQQLNRVLAEQMAAYNHSQAIPGPADLINALHRKVTPRLIELDSFVTMAYLRFDLLLNQVTFVDAGHTRAILTGPDGLRLLSGDNLPLGVMEGEHYQQRVVGISTGDLMFLYSDGLTEARSPDGQEYGLERLSQLVDTLHRCAIPAPILVQAVRKNLNEFEAHQTLSDDRTCIALQFNSFEGYAHPPQTLELPWRLSELSPLRREIASLAREAGLGDEARDALTLAAFEVASNVIRHVECALTNAILYCRLEDDGATVHLNFYYLGEPFSPDATQPDFSGNREGGFGLYIIRNSVDEVIYASPTPGVCRITLSKKKGRADAQA